MKTIAHHNLIGRKQWPAGPWDDEPDKVQWPDPATGMPCLAVRNSLFGNWCGYVGVTEGHPAFGVPYNEVDVNVHGGLTFSGTCAGHICHTTEPDEPDHVYWLGFDCHHCDDAAPGMLAALHDLGGTYRTLAYVQKQCASLAQQLTARSSP